MTAATWTLCLFAGAALLLAWQGWRVGAVRGAVWALALTGVLALCWWWLGYATLPDAAPADWAAVDSVPSTACAKCHADHYESWYRSYHRSMTREATPPNVKGDFHNVIYDYQGLPTRFTRTGDEFFMETVDPAWALARARAVEDSGPDAPRVPPARFVKLK